jgi:hypothetical protein
MQFDLEEIQKTTGEIKHLFVYEGIIVINKNLDHPYYIDKNGSITQLVPDFRRIIDE